MNMDKSAVGWLYKTAHKQFWRVADWYEFDDLVQDGYLCWLKVQQRYVETGAATDPKHVMSLFQRSYINYIHGLASHKLQQIDCPSVDGELRSAEIDGWQAVEFLMAEAPSRLKAAAGGLAKLGNGRSRRRSNGTRETTKERLCRAIGFDPEETGNLRDELRAYLT